MPDEFYHYTSKHEPSLKYEKQLIEEMLQDAIKEVYIKENSNDKIKYKEYTIYIKDINVVKFISNDNGVGFTIFMIMYNEDHEISGINIRNLSIDLESFVKYSTGEGMHLVHLDYTTSTNGGDLSSIYKHELLKKVFPYNESSDSIILPLSEQLYSNIIDYWDAYRGFPSRVSGYYARMFYLSSITITTVGFGDIIPITTRARIAVSIEAIIGIALIGLFVNSLFQNLKF